MEAALCGLAWSGESERAPAHPPAEPCAEPMRGLLLPILLAVPTAHSTNVLVAYHSLTNHTRQLAAAVAAGARGQDGVTVRLQPIAATDVETDVLEWADAIVIGSPVHYGNPSAAMQAWFESAWEPFWTDKRLDGKIGAVFATGGGLAQGLEHVLASMQRLLASFRIQCVTPAPTRSGYDSYGAVAVTGTPPFDGAALAEPFTAAGQALGALVAAEVSRRVALPRTVAGSAHAHGVEAHSHFSASSRGV